jgi:hypothetical protein
MQNEGINCGDCKIQSTGRISIKKYMKEHGLKVGDIITVSFVIKERK